MKEMTVFIDTNIFLHYKMFTEIDWLTILNADKVTIIIPKTVIDELDKHKSNKNLSSKERSRAKKIIKKFFELKQSKSEGISKIKENILIDWLFNPEVVLQNDSQDDKIIEEIQEFRQKNPTLEVIFIVEDFGVHLKCDYYNINTLCLSDNLKLNDELSEDEKRIKELEREIMELKSRKPELKLYFKDTGKDMIELTINQSQTLDIEHEINQIKTQYPIMNEDHFQEESKAEKSEPNKLSISNDPCITLNDVKKYNNQLEQFYKDYQAYLLFVSKIYLTKFLGITIRNLGNIPAEKIYIFLHFPDGFILTKSSAFKIPDEPKPPEKPVPKTFLERSQESLRGLSPIHYLPPQYRNLNSNQAIPNISSPKITPSNSYDVEIKIQKLQHNLSEEIEIFIITYPSFDKVFSFAIDYTIVAENLPDKVQGKLHVKVSCKN